MLTIQIAGKATTTTNNKQVMHINDNEVEIERIGNSIYVNGIPINLIVSDKPKLNWKNIFLGIIIVPGAVIGAYFLLMPNIDIIVEFIRTQSATLIDLVMEFIN